MNNAKADRENIAEIERINAIIRKKLSTDFTTKQICEVIKKKWNLY